MTKIKLTHDETKELKEWGSVEISRGTREFYIEAIPKFDETGEDYIKATEITEDIEVELYN